MLAPESAIASSVPRVILIEGVGGPGASAGGGVGLVGGYGVGPRRSTWAGGTIAGDDCNVIIISNRWARCIGQGGGRRIIKTLI